MKLPINACYFLICRIVMVLAFAAVGGCHYHLATLAVPFDCGSAIPQKISPEWLEIGSFECSGEWLGISCQEVSCQTQEQFEELISQRLAAVKVCCAGPAEAAVSSAKKIIQGHIQFRSSAGIKRSGFDSVGVEGTFQIVDPQQGGVVYSGTWISESVDKDPQKIRLALRKMAAEFLDAVSVSCPIKVKMARGWTSYDRLGRKAASAGDYSQARHYFRLAIDARPDDHAALFNMGLLFETQGDRVQAGRYYQRAVKLAEVSSYRQGLARVRESQ